jgi:hypothetical protein
VDNDLFSLQLCLFIQETLTCFLLSKIAIAGIPILNMRSQDDEVQRLLALSAGRPNQGALSSRSSSISFLNQSLWKLAAAAH